MSEHVIDLSGVTKMYRLYQKPIDRMKESLHPLKKKYSVEKKALNAIDLKVKRGEVLGVIGRNGSGKSTLLKIIAGVLQPSSGQVYVRGRVAAILELGAGFNNEMSGIENVRLSHAINHHDSGKQQDYRINEIVDFAELGAYIDQPIKTYSSGMKARLAFAVAVHTDPDILIVDEALSVGDAAFQRKCFSKMEQIRKSGVTILFVSHSESSIVSFCDRAIWLAGGTQILDGDPKIVTSLYLKYSGGNIDPEKINRDFFKLVSTLSAREDVSHLDESEEKTALSTYNPQIKSLSVVNYDPNGAEIKDVEIFDLSGAKVNVLEHGHEYFLSYRVMIEQPIYSARLGFLIKQKNGVWVGGGAYPNYEECVDVIEKSVRARFKIRIDLAAGDYFFNVGVQKLNDGKYEFAHRILDALMIKVVHSPNDMSGVVKVMVASSLQELH